jgi:hypothetical protein
MDRLALPDAPCLQHTLEQVRSRQRVEGS